jgi:ketosteroid isomerase-like protein
MRFPLPALLLLAAPPSVAAAAAAPAEDSRASLVAFADAFDRAQLAKDGAALEQMVADDLVFIDGSGKRQGKKDFIAGWIAPGDRFDPITLKDRTVLPLGPDAGVVGAETILSGVSGGESFTSHFRFADTFRRVGGTWQAAHIQVTRIP